MNVGYAAGSVAVGAATGATTDLVPGGGSNGLIGACIVAAVGFASLVLAGPLSDRLRRRWRVDHTAEAHDEQTQLTLLLTTQLAHVNKQLEHALATVEAKDVEIIALRKALDRERARHG